MGPCCTSCISQLPSLQPATAVQCCTILGWLQGCCSSNIEGGQTQLTDRWVVRVHHSEPFCTTSYTILHHHNIHWDWEWGHQPDSANCIVWMSVKLCNNSSRNLYCPHSRFLEIFVTFISDELNIRWWALWTQSVVTRTSGTRTSGTNDWWHDVIMDQGGISYQLLVLSFSKNFPLFGDEELFGLSHSFIWYLSSTCLDDDIKRFKT